MRQLRMGLVGGDPGASMGLIHRIFAERDEIAFEVVDASCFDAGWIKFGGQ